MTKPIGDNLLYVAFHTFGLFLYHSFMDRVLNKMILCCNVLTNGEQIVLKGKLPPILAENVLTQSDIEHICQHVHLDAGNMMQW